MKQKIVFSAPVPLILSGDLGFLYGKPALGIALNQRVTAAIFKGSETTKFSDERLARIITQVKKHLQKTKTAYIDKNFSCQSSSSGCLSSAWTVAAVAAFLRFFSGRDFGREIVNDITYQVEKHFDKSVSGMLTTISSMGGLVYYRREFEFLKGIYHLAVKIPKTIEDRLFLVELGRLAPNSSQMMTSVNALYQKSPRLAERLLNNMEKTTKRMIVSFIKEDLIFFRQTLVYEEKLLEAAGAVSSTAQKLIRELTSCATAKLAGGGFLLCFVEDKTRFETLTYKHGLSYCKFRQSLQGVVRETP